MVSLGIQQLPILKTFKEGAAGVGGHALYTGGPWVNPWHHQLNSVW